MSVRKDYSDLRAKIREWQERTGNSYSIRLGANRWTAPVEEFAIVQRQVNLHGSYDFLSIVHYGAYSGLGNGQPFITVQPGYEMYQNLMGAWSQISISQGDRMAIAEIYGPPASGPLPAPVIQELSATITYPLTGTLISYGQNIAIHVDVQSSGTAIAKVEFYDGEAKIGEATNSPF